MNPPCSRCKKTVYPVEKLTCLDKTWHKACFTCEVCNLKLTMKTYKGYNKLPYCNTHYPTTRFTAVADTPENRRLAQQSKNQSELVYRKDHEETLKHFTQVSDSVGTKLAQSQQALASNIGYQTAPHEQERIGGYNAPPPQSYSAPYQAAPQIPPPMQQKAPAPPPPSGPCYVAIYDYTAADDDEVSFAEGDTITDVTVIDEGWMEGRVQRTGAYGMLPSNYVEKQ